MSFLSFLLPASLKDTKLYQVIEYRRKTAYTGCYEVRGQLL